MFSDSVFAAKYINWPKNGPVPAVCVNAYGGGGRPVHLCQAAVYQVMECRTCLAEQHP